jgi:hypothetical protein
MTVQSCHGRLRRSQTTNETRALTKTTSAGRMPVSAFSDQTSVHPATAKAPTVR